MKKSISVIALLLVAALTVMCFAACDSISIGKGRSSSEAADTDSKVEETEEPTVEETQADTLVGTYKIIGGTEIDEDTLDQIRDITSLVVNEDLTAKLSVGSNSLEFSFDPETNVVTAASGSTATYVLEGKILTLTMDSGLTEIYEKISD